MRASFGALFLVVLAGCGVTQAEHENLILRVKALENRVAVVEGRREPDGSEKKLPKGNVSVEGDAVRVYVRHKKHRYPVPGAVPPGNYSIRAVFQDGSPPVVSGRASVVAGKTTKISCVRADRRCTADAPIGGE